MTEIPPFNNSLTLNFEDFSQVRSEEELRMAAKSLMQVMDKPLSYDDSRVFGSSFRRIVAADIEFAARSEEGMGSSIAEVLRLPVSKSRKKLVQTSVESVFKRILLGTELDSSMEACLHPESSGVNIASAMEAYDAKSFVRSAFWFDIPVISKGTTRLPAFLRMLHTKLATKGNRQHIKNTMFKDSIGPAQSYLTQVLCSYERDSNRDPSSVNNALNQSKVLPGDEMIDSRLLTSMANRLSLDYCAQIGLGGPDLGRHPNLLRLPIDRNISDSFFRVTSSFRSLYTPHYVRVAQIEQDRLHADVATLLCNVEHNPTSISDIDIAIRFSDAKAENLEDARSLIARGKTPERALKTVFNRRSSILESIILS